MGHLGERGRWSVTGPGMGRGLLRDDEFANRSFRMLKDGKCGVAGERLQWGTVRCYKRGGRKVEIVK